MGRVTRRHTYYDVVSAVAKANLGNGEESPDWYLKFRSQRSKKRNITPPPPWTLRYIQEGFQLPQLLGFGA